MKTNKKGEICLNRPMIKEYYGMLDFSRDNKLNFELTGESYGNSSSLKIYVDGDSYPKYFNLTNNINAGLPAVEQLICEEIKRKVQELKKYEEVKAVALHGIERVSGIMVGARFTVQLVL